MTAASSHPAGGGRGGGSSSVTASVEGAHVRMHMQNSSVLPEGQGIAKTCLTDSNEEASVGLVSQQLFCLPGDRREVHSKVRAL